jgi:predicted transcriptional regulator
LSTFVKLKKNKGNNRHSLDIVRDILSVASANVRKTRIMYQANLSYYQVEKYLHNLLEQGLLKHNENSCYLITIKGMEFLELYDSYVERCRLIKEEVDQSMKEKKVLEKMCSESDFNGEAEFEKEEDQ